MGARKEAPAMSMQREPEALQPREGSEEYFCGKSPDMPEQVYYGMDEALLPPPQEMGEDG
jgi:hypothetical protein